MIATQKTFRKYLGELMKGSSYRVNILFPIFNTCNYQKFHHSKTFVGKLRFAGSTLSLVQRPKTQDAKTPYDNIPTKRQTFHYCTSLWC